MSSIECQVSNVEYRKVEYREAEIRKSRINKVSDATYISDVVFLKPTPQNTSASATSFIGVARSMFPEERCKYALCEKETMMNDQTIGSTRSWSL